jgi:hypothetical protein
MYFTPDLNGIRFHDPNKAFHHWCPYSEAYATVSQLLSAVNTGWQLHRTVTWQTIHFSSSRQSRVYAFKLRRNGQHMTMPVLENPALLRLLVVEAFATVEYADFYEETGYAVGD